MKQHKNDDSRLAADLRSLGEEAPRDPQKAAENRAAFVADAWKIRQAVSKTQPERHKNWESFFAPIVLKPGREGFSMVNAALLVTMVLGLIFGGGGITVSAAQSAMPDDALYAVKLATEQVRLQLAGDGEAEFQLALEFANRRMEEAQTMLQNGDVPDEALMNRIQEQNDNCLRLALGLSEDQVVPALIMLQEKYRQQLQVMEQLNMPDDAALEAVRLRLRTSLEMQLQLAQLGVGDQLKLQEELQIREQLRIQQKENDAQREEEQNQYQNQDGSGAGSDGSNGSQWQGESPTEGSGDGGGESQNPWTTDTPTPGSGYGPGESQNPWTTSTPTPGSGYGPGPGDCTTCTPQSGTPSGSGGSKP